MSDNMSPDLQLYWARIMEESGIDWTAGLEGDDGGLEGNITDWTLQSQATGPNVNFEQSMHQQAVLRDALFQAASDSHHQANSQLLRPVISDHFSHDQQLSGLEKEQVTDWHLNCMETDQEDDILNWTFPNRDNNGSGNDDRLALGNENR